MKLNLQLIEALLTIFYYISYYLKFIKHVRRFIWFYVEHVDNVGILTCILKHINIFLSFKYEALESVMCDVIKIRLIRRDEKSRINQKNKNDSKISNSTTNFTKTAGDGGYCEGI